MKATLNLGDNNWTLNIHYLVGLKVDKYNVNKTYRKKKKYRLRGRSSETAKAHRG
eukprot:TRINITY_DN1998_c0_g1_i1.p1 TRINITY_DN1998_c0_g1~~TRINITY_DN1998_c0_g1_i1.p1  ORF type:complete len:55 (+),score=24.53 TRINITY_DN1998_c0_g1_i1:406-570(+)